MVLIEAILKTLDRRAAEPAVWFDQRWYSFGELRQRSTQVAVSLGQQGLEPGDRVAVGLPNSVDLICAVIGVLQAGAILVPLNPAYTAEELQYVLADSGARFAIPPAAELATTTPRNDGTTAGLIVYTSGTTGKPKGAVLSQRALLSNFTEVARAWQWTQSDRLLLTLPCFHLHGLGLGILTSLLIGSSIVLRERFELDRVLPDLGEHGVTMFFGVPTIYNRLVTLPEASVRSADLSRMRLWVSGSAPLNPVTWDRFRQRFGYQLMDRYGMTECGFALSTPYQEPRRAGVVGRPLPGVDVRLVDPDRRAAGDLVDVADGAEGEIAIKGINLFDGYWQRPAETAAAMCGGYLCSGDIAVREPDRQFRIVGRSSVDIIKTRGFKVGAGEIEAVLQRYAGVEEVAVVGVPDADQGERVVAVVSRSPDATWAAAELLAHARQYLVPHKVPAEVVLMEEIPKTGPGKIKKKELIARLNAR